MTSLVCLHRVDCSSRQPRIRLERYTYEVTFRSLCLSLTALRVFLGRRGILVQIGARVTENNVEYAVVDLDTLYILSCSATKGLLSQIHHRYTYIVLTPLLLALVTRKQGNLCLSLESLHMVYEQSSLPDRASQRPTSC
jgi:hypothetical protein